MATVSFRIYDNRSTSIKRLRRGLPETTPTAATTPRTFASHVEISRRLCASKNFRNQTHDSDDVFPDLLLGHRWRRKFFRKILLHTGNPEILTASHTTSLSCTVQVFTHRTSASRLTCCHVLTGFLPVLRTPTVEPVLSKRYCQFLPETGLRRGWVF